MAVAILFIVCLYVAIGALFSVLFLLRGIEKIDPAAHGAPWTFRLLILPGVLALWPLLAQRWIRAARAEHRP